MIDDERIHFQYQAHTMSDYSPHAAQSGFLDFVEGIPPSPKEIHLVHRENKAKYGLSRLLIALGYHVHF